MTSKIDKVFDPLKFGHMGWKPPLETLPLTGADGKPFKPLKPLRGRPQSALPEPEQDTENE